MTPREGAEYKRLLKAAESIYEHHMALPRSRTARAGWDHWLDEAVRLRAEVTRLRVEGAFADLELLLRDPSTETSVSDAISKGVADLLDDANEWLAAREAEAAA